MTFGSLALAPDTSDAVQTDHPRDRRRRGTRAEAAKSAESPSREPPDERRLRGLGQALAEILAGRRPPETVQERLTERAYAGLCRSGKMIDTPRPPLVGTPHVQRPHADALEMCLIVHCGTRSRALAVRLERFGVQWLVTDFETA
jgi:hypothetical protein